MIDHVAISCGATGCAATVWMTPDELDRRKRTHETWYCPAGHSRAFVDKTQQEKEIERLCRDLDWYEEQIQALGDEIKALEATCPWTACGFVGSSQRARTNHMIRAHGMPSLAAVREAAS